MSVYDKEKSDETELENIASKESDAGVLYERKDNAKFFDSEQKSLEKSFYNPNSDEEYEKIKISGRKKKVGISAGVLVVLFGGGIGIFSMLAQPLQFIQMSSMLRNFHFSDSEDFSDGRMTRLARYVRYRSDGSLQKTRLSYLGNKYADRLETRLNKSGLQSTYDGPRSTFSGYIIDPENTDSSKTLGDIENKTPDEIKSDLSKKYGIDAGQISVDGNKILIKPDGLSGIGSKRLLRASLQDAGYSKIGAAMRARIMGKRAGVTWNPLKVLDRSVSKSVSARMAEFKEARAKRINNGASVDFNTTGEPDPATDPEGGPTENPTNNEASNALDDLKNGSGTPAENIKSNIGKAAGGIAIIGVVCGVQALANGYDDVKHFNVVLPLMRVGVEALAVGDQIVTGQNLDPAHIDAMTELMYDEELQNSWRSARSIQAEAGDKNLTGPDVLDEAKISADGNIFTKFLNSIPGLDVVCGFSNSAFGSIISFGLDVVTGPVSAVIGFVTEQLLAGPLASGLINWLAGNPIDVEVAGANYGNYINYGARLAANDTAIASGGRKLSGAEVAELKSIRLKNEQIDFNQKSFVAKIFDAKDYRTPAGKFIANQAPNPAQNVARVVSNIPKSASSIFTPIKTIVTSKVSAESSYDYGFDKYGFSADEENNAAIENPFENDEYVANLLDANRDEINKKTEKCFGISIVKKLFAGEERWTPESMGAVPKYKDISDSTAGPSCDDASEEFLRIRAWIHDTQLMASYACFEDGADNTCVEFGLAPDTGSSAVSSTNPETSTGVANVSCDGYLKLASAPAVVSGGFPSNTETVPYNQKVKDVCNNIKEQCLAGVADTTKILCSALEFHDSWYGNIYSKYGSVSSNQYYYGISTISNALYDPGRWYSSRKLGLNSTNILDCSALTAVALYRAYGYGSPIGCSGSWGQSSKPNLFKNVSWEEVRPGDFLTYSKSCNSNGFGHIAIAASTVAPDGSFVVFEQSLYGTTAHFRLANKSSWGIKAGVTSTFGGHLSRWIGPGVN